MMLATSSLSQAPQGGSDLPNLYGIRLDGARITIDVVSYGKTVASDFSVHLDPASPEVYRLSVVRNRQDTGRVSPHIVGLTLEIPPVPSLGTAKFLLTNNLGTTGNPLEDPRALLRSDP